MYEHMSQLQKSKDGFSVSAYTGDGAILFVFDLQKHLTKNLPVLPFFVLDLQITNLHVTENIGYIIWLVMIKH